MVLVCVITNPVSTAYFIRVGRWNYDQGTLSDEELAVLDIAPREHAYAASSGLFYDDGVGLWFRNVFIEERGASEEAILDSTSHDALGVSVGIIRHMEVSWRDGGNPFLIVRQVIGLRNFSIFQLGFFIAFGEI